MPGREGRKEREDLGSARLAGSGEPVGGTTAPFRPYVEGETSTHLGATERAGGHEPLVLARRFGRVSHNPVNLIVVLLPVGLVPVHAVIDWRFYPEMMVGYV